jgi:putative folate metabolism gamma-glutamate ligase
MNISGIKTKKITVEDSDLLKILDEYVVEMREEEVLIITSKIVSICEGRVVPINSIEKAELVKQDADYYLMAPDNKYGLILTIKDGHLIPWSGIDESNGNGYFIRWPEDPYKTAFKIRDYLVERFGLKHIGVIITDSKLTPLRWGETGLAIAYTGFKPLRSYIGTTDLFGREMKLSQASVADCLATAAVLVMGEGDESTPMVIASDIPNIEYFERNTTQEEIDSFKIEKEKDLFGELLNSVMWESVK